MENISINSVGTESFSQTIFDHVREWETAPLTEKQRIVDIMINKITITYNHIDIDWNI